MNCSDCGDTEQVKKNTGLALELLRESLLSKEDRDKAVFCRECASNKMVALLKERLL